MHLFVHRSSVFAVQVKFADKWGYVPIYRELTVHEIDRHLSGKVTLGVYALNTDNTVKWICFDIDGSHVENPESVRDLIFNRCIDRFTKSCVRIESSGSPHSYHVWLFINPIPALYARALGHDILKDIENVELFPKQSTLQGKALGNLVKLPLGFHRKSDTWSKIADLETVVPRVIDVSEIEIKSVPPPSSPTNVEAQFPAYDGADPNCIAKIKRGVKKGERNNAGIILASYLLNFRRFQREHAFYVFRCWNEANRPKLNRSELDSIFNQAVEGEYIFGCNNEYLRQYCTKEKCVFGGSING